MMATQISTLNLDILILIGLETLETIIQSQALFSSWLAPPSVGAQRNSCQFHFPVLKASTWPSRMLPRKQFGFNSSYVTSIFLSPILPLSLLTIKVPLC